MIRVVIVDDSRVAREFLEYVLSADPALQVVGFANDARAAVAAARDLRPDVMTMDIHMPGGDGFEATRAIMASTPVPIVIVSASSQAKDAAGVFRTLEAGALAVVLRPPGLGHPGHALAARELIQIVKAMSEIKVVKRHARLANAGASALPPVRPDPAIQLLAMGASIGGPPALCTILARLPRDWPVPVVIVQHIAAGFTDGFVEWLAGASGFPVHLAAPGQPLAPGHAYVAPDGFHLGVEGGPRLVFSRNAPEYGSRPSVANLFRTAAQALGPRAVGVLLTGMGRDGADELKLLKDRGAITLAQDEASSVVHGMPGEAIRLGAATYVLAPENMAALLVHLVRPAKVAA